MIIDSKDTLFYSLAKTKFDILYFSKYRPRSEVTMIYESEIWSDRSQNETRIILFSGARSMSILKN